MKNYELVNRGLALLRDSLAPYIAREVMIDYGENWWSDAIVDKLYDHQKRDLPSVGDWGELVDSLDILNCLTLLADIHWESIFKKKLSQKHRTLANELKSARHDSAHIGGVDFSDDDAWRALDTMERFLREIDSECAKEIKTMQKSIFANPTVMSPIAQSSKCGVTKSSTENSNATQKIPLCDDCGSHLVERSGQYGEFLGCSAFPNCRKTRSLAELCVQSESLRTVVLISCTKTQRQGFHKAKELYSSISFKESLEFAQKITDSIFILSSKHGLLDLNAEVGNYDEPLAGKSNTELDMWGQRVVEQLEGYDVDISNTNFVILAYSDYYSPLLKHFKHHETPLRGVRAHDKSAKLKELARDKGL